MRNISLGFSLKACLLRGSGRFFESFGQARHSPTDSTAGFLSVAALRSYLASACGHLRKPRPDARLLGLYKC